MTRCRLLVESEARASCEATQPAWLPVPAVRTTSGLSAALLVPSLGVVTYPSLTGDFPGREKYASSTRLVLLDEGFRCSEVWSRWLVSDCWVWARRFPVWCCTNVATRRLVGRSPSTTD